MVRGIKRQRIFRMVRDCSSGLGVCPGGSIVDGPTLRLGKQSATTGVRLMIVPTVRRVKACILHVGSQRGGLVPEDG